MFIIVTGAVFSSQIIWWDHTRPSCLWPSFCHAATARRPSHVRDGRKGVYDLDYVTWEQRDRWMKALLFEFRQTGSPVLESSSKYYAINLKVNENRQWFDHFLGLAFLEENFKGRMWVGFIYLAALRWRNPSRKLLYDHHLSSSSIDEFSPEHQTWPFRAEGREGREREIGEERIFSSFVFSVQLSCISRVYHLKANSVDRHLAHSSNIW